MNAHPVRPHGEAIAIGIAAALCQDRSQAAIQEITNVPAHDDDVDFGHVR